MSEHGGCERGTARLIRAGEVGRLVPLATERANDNRRRSGRGPGTLARAVVAAAPARHDRAEPAHAVRPWPARPEPDRPAPGLALATSWLGPNLAFWSLGLRTACRLPPVASGLALCRAWSELGLSGAASCASVAASGAELFGLAVTGMIAAAIPGRRPPAAASAERAPDG